jgi:hypothetical protein
LEFWMIWNRPVLSGQPLLLLFCNGVCS